MLRTQISIGKEDDGEGTINSQCKKYDLTSAM